MKDFLFGKTFQSILLGAYVAAATVILFLWKAFPTLFLVEACVLGAVGVLFVRFDYGLALWYNRVYSFFNRRNRNESDDEPSGFAVIVNKILGFLLLIPLTVMLFL